MAQPCFLEQIILTFDLNIVLTYNHPLIKAAIKNDNHEVHTFNET